MSNEEFEFKVLGDRGLLMEFGNKICTEINRRIQQWDFSISSERVDGIIDTIPGYASLLILYDPCRLDFEALKNKMINLSERVDTVTLEDSRTIEIPVVYGGESGPDLQFVARCHHLSSEEVIQIHTSVIYTVYTLGTTGFAYLGDLPEQIHTPRLETPRSLIPAGSVGIGNTQTGVYPIEGPSGWQIIGRTTFQIYDPAKEPPVLFRPGNKVKFLRVVK